MLFGRSPSAFSLPKSAIDPGAGPYVAPIGTRKVSLKSHANDCGAREGCGRAQNLPRPPDAAASDLGPKVTKVHLKRAISVTLCHLCGQRPVRLPIPLPRNFTLATSPANENICRSISASLQANFAPPGSWQACPEATRFRTLARQIALVES
jgi:hypothetical protein